MISQLFFQLLIQIANSFKSAGSNYNKNSIIFNKAKSGSTIVMGAFSAATAGDANAIASGFENNLGTASIDGYSVLKSSVKSSVTATTV